MWGAQLLVPLVGLLFVGFRMRYGDQLGPLYWVLTLVCLGWFLGGVAILLTPVGRRWLRRHRGELLLAFSSVALMTLVADLALTLTGRVPTLDEVYSRFALHYRPSVFTLGRLEPNQSLVVEGGPTLDINSRGFRGPDVPVPKPPGTYRIVFLGGSQVFDQDGGNWPVEVGRLLSTPERPVDVVNAGVPSHRTADSVGKCMAELWMMEPDALVLCQAWNDIKYFTRLTPDTPYRDLFQPLPNDWRLQPTGPDRLLSWSAFYRVGRARVVKLMIGAEGERRRSAQGRMNEWGIRQYELDVQLLCDLGANLGADVLLCKQARLPVSGTEPGANSNTAYDYVGLDHAELMKAFAACDRVIEDVASRKNAVLIDMNGALSGRAQLFSDHIHFSPEGSREAARVVATGLRESSLMASD